ncbi:outer membrane beta-barrel family protein [Dyadobacter sp. LJ53]|uniref:outer membrane beta-barrel protein n=1 Tax=Dyadobacter chenwenxiniae TaxID=2906456 RepID=UPI001F3AC2FD|nr:outer membrane beta-barrel protein [Dyadobacter chenwenxiniae]MCF0049091.1 outer membrane beta-barrel family protein [Dyadobacter chenwenxiniae]
MNASGSFIIGKGWTAEINGWISTPETIALRYFDWKGTLDAGIQKIFSPKLKARLSIQDIFHTNRSLAILDNPELKSTTTIRTDSRVVLLNLSWSFGNQKLKAARQRKTSSDEEIKRAN